MLAQAAAQRLMDEMRHRVVAAEAVAPIVIDAQLDGVADLERAVGDGAEMDEELARLLHRVADRKLARSGREHDAAITHLAAGLGVERRLIDDDRGLLP